MAQRYGVKGRTGGGYGFQQQQQQYKARPPPLEAPTTVLVDDESGGDQRVLVFKCLEVTGDSVTMYCRHKVALGRTANGGLNSNFDDAIEAEDEESGDTEVVNQKRADKCCTGIQANKQALGDLRVLAQKGMTHAILGLCSFCKKGNGFFIDKVNCYVAQDVPHALCRCGFMCPGVPLAKMFVKYDATKHIDISELGSIKWTRPFLEKCLGADGTIKLSYAKKMATLPMSDWKPENGDAFNVMSIKPALAPLAGTSKAKRAAAAKKGGNRRRKQDSDDEEEDDF